jgi:hypothetical protein
MEADQADVLNNLNEYLKSVEESKEFHEITVYITRPISMKDAPDIQRYIIAKKDKFRKDTGSDLGDQGVSNLAFKSCSGNMFALRYEEDWCSYMPVQEYHAGIVALGMKEYYGEGKILYVALNQKAIYNKYDKWIDFKSIAELYNNLCTTPIYACISKLLKKHIRNHKIIVSQNAQIADLERYL